MRARTRRSAFSQGGFAEGVTHRDATKRVVTLRRLTLHSHLIRDPQPPAAMKRVAYRLRAGGAIEEEVGDPALGDAEAEPAAIFEPALVAENGHDRAVAGHARDD